MNQHDLIAGLGGAFVFARDPRKLAAWYERALGFAFDASGPFYRCFWSRDVDDPERCLDFTFSILSLEIETEDRTPEEEPTDPALMYGDQPYMLNFRVRNMKQMLDHLEAEGIRVLASQNEGYGQFVWIRDPEGNRIELYQGLERSEPAF